MGQKSAVLKLFLAVVCMVVMLIGTGNVKAQSQVEISAYLPGQDEQTKTAFVEIIENFEKKNPQIRVNFQMIPWSEYFTKLNAAFAGGVSPDVFGLGYGQFGPVSYAGKTLALNDYLKDWDGWQDIPENILDAGSKDGKLHAVLFPEVRPLFYREDLFAKAGLEKPPETTVELKEYARKLNKIDGQIFGLEVPSGNGWQFLLSYLLMCGAAEALWDENLDPVFDKPEVIKAVREIYSYYEEGLTTYSDALDLQGTLFENGLAAMSLSVTSANLVRMLETLEPAKVGVSLPPGRKVLAMGTFFAVSSETKHKEEALDFFKAINSKEGQLIMAKAVGFVATRKSAAEEYIALYPKYNRVFADSIGNARVIGPTNPLFFDYREIIQDAIEKIYYGVEDAETALKKAAQDCREVLTERLGK